MSKDEITDLCTVVYHTAAAGECEQWPPSLGLFKSVAVTLSYLRRNRVQAELAETFGVSQPTVSRAIARVTVLLEQALTGYAPVAEDLDPDTQYIVDGTLLPCWSWRDHQELYSGKHKTTGYNVQVACDLHGNLAWVSDPVDGCRHDTAALSESGVLVTHDPANWLGDKGYVGNNMITPIKKPACRELLDWEKDFNTALNKIRYIIERSIANLKTWRILHTDYRRPLATFKQTISIVVGLAFFQRPRE